MRIALPDGSAIDFSTAYFVVNKLHKGDVSNTEIVNSLILLTGKGNKESIDKYFAFYTEDDHAQKGIIAIRKMYEGESVFYYKTSDHKVFMNVLFGAYKGGVINAALDPYYHDTEGRWSYGLFINLDLIFRD